MNYNINNWNDIIPIQYSCDISALRISYNVNEKNSISFLKIINKKLNLSEYNPITSDILKYIIEAMRENSIFSEKSDLSLLQEIIYNSSHIAITSKRGYGNFAIFSENTSKVFLQKNLEYIIDGKINGVINYYTSTHLQDGVIIGYIGPHSILDSGLILSIIDNQFQIGNMEGSNKYYRFIPHRS